MTRFHSIAEEIRSHCSLWELKLHSLDPALASLPRNSQGRSVREILGHMVDSASNNTHRIIHLQYQESPCAFPDYANLGNNDRWIALQNYQQEAWQELVELWSAVHRHIAHVMEQVNEQKLGQLWISALGEEVSLEAMIRDFPRHFHLHLGEITQLLESS